MRLTTKGRFAVTAMIDLAMHGGKGPVTLAAVSERQKISLVLPRAAVRQAAPPRAGRERARPGRRLQPRRAPPSAVSVADIILAVDEPIDATQCGGKENCLDDRRCMTHDLWASLNAHIFSFLHSVYARAAGARSRPSARSTCCRIIACCAGKKSAPAPVGVSRRLHRDHDEATDLPRLFGDDAGRSARRAEDDPVPDRALRQPGVALARVRLGDRSRRSRRRASKSRRSSTATRRRSSGPPARPSRSTSRSRARRISTRTRASTSSR